MKNIIKDIILNDETYSKELDEELVEYSLKILKSFLINLFITTIIGMLMQKIRETLCFYTVFFILRKITGGFHLKSRNLCMIVSIIICILSVLFADYLGKTNSNIINSIIVSISNIIIIVFSPVVNENKPLTFKQIKIYKIESAMLSLFFGIISVILLKMNSDYSFYFSIALFDVGCLVFIAYLKQLIKHMNNK